MLIVRPMRTAPKSHEISTAQCGATDVLRPEVGIRDLERHADRHSEISEVSIVGRVILVEVDAGALRAVPVKEARIAQRNTVYCVHESNTPNTERAISPAFGARRRRRKR